MKKQTISKNVSRKLTQAVLNTDRGSLVLSGESFERLRVLVEQVKDDTIDKEDLVYTLNKICKALHNICTLQKREILDDDSEFSDLLNSFDNDDETQESGKKVARFPRVREPRVNVVSKEVRSWLESTFTKQANLQLSTVNSPKLTFKQAAIKIKARIKLHRLFGTGAFICLKPSPEANAMFRENVGNWSFDVFHLNSLVEGHVLTYMGVKIFQRHRICDNFNIPCKVLEAFLSQLESGYSKYNNPYHNLIHAADVVHTCNSIMEGSGLTDIMTEEEKFAMFFAALIHDFEHAGTTNAYQINVRSHLALLYNDRGVLENHHISAAYRVTQLPAFNIFVNVSRCQFQDIRRLVIEMVLNTDMTLHFSQIKTVNKLIKLPEEIERPKAYSLILHAADISHPTKSWELHEKWTLMLVEEFFNQGDNEIARGLPVSPLCDRQTTMVPQSQVGFINFIVIPTFQLLYELLIKLYKDVKKEEQEDEIDSENIQFPGDFQWMDQLQQNKSTWEDKAIQETEKEENSQKEYLSS